MGGLQRHLTCECLLALFSMHIYTSCNAVSAVFVSWRCCCTRDGVAGVVNVLVTTPLWVANTRLKLQGAKLHTKAYGEASDRKYDGIRGRSHKCSQV